MATPSHPNPPSKILRALAVALALILPAPAIATLQGVTHGAIAPATDLKVAESYKLPISAPADQGESDLCWVYATLSMLETNYLAKHPNSNIALSRGALQRASIVDRFRRQLAGGPAYLEDGGVAVDALELIRQNGLLAASDFHDVVDSEPIFKSVADQIAAASGQTAKQDALDRAISGALGATPGATRLDGKDLTPAQLAKTLLEDNVWTEYDVTSEGVARVGPATDPDARPDTQVHFVPLATAVDLIHASLKRGQAVVWGTENHALMIYGADYDASGQPVAYWIKDSFAPYSYRAAAGEIHKVMTDVTVAAPPPSHVADTQGDKS